MDHKTVKLLTYRGKGKDFPVWSTRFVAMMRTMGPYKSLLGTEEQPNEPAPLANAESNGEKNNNDAYEWKFQTSRRYGTMCDAIWHWLQMYQFSCCWDMILWEMTAPEREQKLGSFAREFSKCGNAERADFGGTACSTAAWGFCEFGQLLHQRTRIAHKAKRSRENNLRDNLQRRLGPQWSANEVWKFC